MGHKDQVFAERKFPPQVMQHVVAVSEDAILVCGAGHEFCNFAIIPVHKNARVRAVLREQISRPKYCDTVIVGPLCRRIDRAGGLAIFREERHYSSKFAFLVFWTCWGVLARSGILSMNF